jgi:hypothetical protein
MVIPCQFRCWVTSCNEGWFVLCQFHFPWIWRGNGCYEPTFSLAEQRTLLIKALFCFSTYNNQHPQASTGFCTKDTSIWLTTNITFGLVPTFQLHQGINLQSRNSTVKFVKIDFQVQEAIVNRTRALRFHTKKDMANMKQEQQIKYDTVCNTP